MFKLKANIKPFRMDGAGLFKGMRFDHDQVYSIVPPARKNDFEPIAITAVPEYTAEEDKPKKEKKVKGGGCGC